MTYKKLATKKLSAPKRHHRGRMRRNPDAEPPSARQLEKVRGEVANKVPMILRQLNEKLVRNMSTTNLALIGTDLARVREDMITFLTKAHFEAFDKLTKPDEEAQTVILRVLNFAPGGEHAMVSESATAMQIIQPELCRIPSS